MSEPYFLADEKPQNETDFAHSDDSHTTDELQAILSAGETTTEENSILDELMGGVEQSDEQASILNSNFETAYRAEEHDGDDLAETVENIVRDILGEYDDLTTESPAQNHAELINTDEFNSTPSIDEMTTTSLKDIIPGFNPLPDSESETRHDNIVARIESLWAELAEVWPVIQEQPHVVEKIKELWNILKQAGNETIEIPSEFEHLLQGTNTGITSSKYEIDLNELFPNKNITEEDPLFPGYMAAETTEQSSTINEAGELDTYLNNYTAADDADNLLEMANYTTQTDEADTSSYTVDEIVNSLIERDEAETKTNTTNDVDDLLKITNDTAQADEANTSSYTADEIVKSLIERDEADTETAIVDDKLGELVANILGENTESGETPLQEKKETNWNTSPDNAADELEAILAKYSTTEANQLTAEAEPEVQQTGTTSLNNEFIIDEQLQTILKGTADFKTSDKTDNQQTNQPSGNDTIKPVMALNQPVTKRRSTPRRSVTKSTQPTTTQRKSHLNETSESDAPSYGWKWAVVSLLPIVIIAIIWPFLSTDDAVNHEATSTNNLALHTEQTNTGFTDTTADENREESIQDVARRMNETVIMHTEATVETIPFNELTTATIETTIEPVNNLLQSSEQSLTDLTDHVSQLGTTIADLQQRTSEATAETDTEPTNNFLQSSEQNLSDLTDHIKQLETTIADLQQKTSVGAEIQTSEKIDTLPAEEITQLVNVSVNSLQQGMEQGVQELSARITRLETAVVKLQQSAQLLQQKTTSENKARIDISQGNQQRIQSLIQRITSVENSLQQHATNISHAKIKIGNVGIANTLGNTGTAHAIIEKDNDGITITLNKPSATTGKQTNTNGKYQTIDHTVSKGDTLWDIAKRYVDNPFLYPELATLNNIKNPDLIYPGNRVRIIKHGD